MKELYVLINEKIRVLVVRGKGEASNNQSGHRVSDCQRLLTLVIGKCCCPKVRSTRG